MQVTRLNSAYEAYDPSRFSSSVRAAAAVAIRNASDDGVRLSGQSKMLGSLPALIAPTQDNVRSMAASAAADLQAGLADAGIAPSGPLQFDLDSASGKVSVKANSPDATRVNAMLADHPDLALKIHNVMALGSHVIATEPSLKFDAEYRQVQGTPEANKVLEKYSALLSGKVPQTDMSLVYSAGTVQVNANGAAWLNVRG